MRNMKFNCKPVILSLLAACLTMQLSATAFAAVSASQSDMNKIGPGFENAAESSQTPETSEAIPAWTRVNGVYVDNNGSPISGALLRGISVSKWQGDIDWSKVAQDDVSFAFVRMVSYGYEGGYTMDEYFEKNIREARANGLHVAPYIYLQTKTVEEAREAARFAVEIAKNYDITYPIAVDIESSYILELSTQELTDVVNAFCQVISESGYTPIVYSDYSKFTTEMDTAQIPYEIWLARYGGDNNYPNRTIWQSTQEGTVKGISGYVCLEFAFKDYAPSDTGLTPGQWQNENGVWYFANEGNRYTGWVKPDGKWYYLDPENGGAMVADVTMIIDGVSYAFDGSGVMQ